MEKNKLKKIGLIILLISYKKVVYATEDPLKAVDNLSDFFFQLVKAIGVMIAGLGAVQFGMSLKSQDSSQRANGFWAIAGGIVIAFSKEIINRILG